MFSGLLQCSFAKSCFKQNTLVTQGLPSPFLSRQCCASSLMTPMSETAAYVIMFVLVFKNKHLLRWYNLLIKVKQREEYDDRKLK